MTLIRHTSQFLQFRIRQVQKWGPFGNWPQKFEKFEAFSSFFSIFNRHLGEILGALFYSELIRSFEIYY